MVGKCGILPFELARLFAGGISDYRLHRLIEDETLARKEDGLDAEQFFVALKQQEEVRRPRVKVRREDGSARLLLAFTPGSLEVWEAGVSAERLPGLDYDTAIRDAIVEGSSDPAAAAAIEAAIWLRFGDPAAARLEDLKQLARVIATGWPKVLLWRDPPNWRDNSGRRPGRRRLPSEPACRARDGSVDEALDNSARSRPTHRPRQKRSDPRGSAVLGGQGAAFQSAVRRRGERAHRRNHRPVRQDHGPDSKNRRAVF